MIIEDNALVEEYLEHHGIKGQKWGVRKAHDVSGLSRHRRAALDRNARLIDLHQKAINRTGSKRLNVLTGADKMLLGKKRFEKMHNVRISRLEAQNKRIQDGHLFIRDRIDIWNQPLGSVFLEKKAK